MDETAKATWAIYRLLVVSIVLSVVSAAIWFGGIPALLCLLFIGAGYTYAEHQEKKKLSKAG